MVYNEEMDKLLNNIVSKWKKVIKKKMFGGTGYLLNGNMVAGIYKDYYIIRLGEENANAAIKSPNINLLDITGRPMKGWVMIGEDSVSKDNLISWLKKAKEFVLNLPPK